MKKSLFVSLMLFCAGINAQTYAFDFLTKYKLKTKDPKHEVESVNYFNSDDFAYYMHLVKGPDSFRALLTDRGRMLAHRFTVTESKVKGEIYFSFTYDSSFKLNNRSKEIKSRIEFKEIPGSTHQVLMKKYASKKAKKPVSEERLTLSPANKNLFRMYSISRSSEVDYGINYPGNHIVTRAEITEGKENCEVVLDEYMNVDLVLTLPTELKF